MNSSMASLNRSWISSCCRCCSPTRAPGPFPPGHFFRTAILSAATHSETSDLVFLFYTTSEVYKILGMISKFKTALRYAPLQISSCIKLWVYFDCTFLDKFISRMPYYEVRRNRQAMPVRTHRLQTARSPLARDRTVFCLLGRSPPPETRRWRGCTISPKSLIRAFQRSPFCRSLCAWRSRSSFPKMRSILALAVSSSRISSLACR